MIYREETNRYWMVYCDGDECNEFWMREDAKELQGYWHKIKRPKKFSVKNATTKTRV